MTSIPPGPKGHPMTHRKLFEYYAEQGVLPTFCAMRGEDELADYAAGRQKVFNDKLLIPTRVFKGAAVLEFGPDTGENALCCARWGARMTLVEPNTAAHRQIRAYFDQFGLTGQLVELVATDLENFRSEALYDVIIAEGFIYTVQPSALWLDALRRSLAADGLAVVSYSDRIGSFVESLSKALYAGYRRHSRLPPTEAGRALFETKWNSIPHTRTFESWVTDVLENPFVRSKYYIDSRQLMGEAAERGLRVYSSWPVYRDPLAISWHKKVIPAEEHLSATQEHIARGCLSYLCGRRLYFAGDAAAAVALAETLGRLVGLTDRMIDADDPDAASRCRSLLAALPGELDGMPLLAAAADRRAAKDLIAAAIRLLDCLADAPSRLPEAMRGNEPFTQGWGMPNHYVAFQRGA